MQDALPESANPRETRTISAPPQQAFGISVHALKAGFIIRSC
jgi:hypothetical protein